MMSCPALCSHRFCLFSKKALSTHPLSGLIPPLSLPIPHRIPPNPSSAINSNPKISQRRIKIANLAYILLPIRRMRIYWGYKNHVLVDCISSLPICEITTTAETADSAVALDLLADTHRFLPVAECTFFADKGYDVKNIYNQVKQLYDGECIIPINKRNTKNSKLLPWGNPVCDAGLVMWKDGKFSDCGRTRPKFCCPLKNYTGANCP